MNDINLSDKVTAIQNAVHEILACFGKDFFEYHQHPDSPNKLVDYWEADLNAIGLKRKEKLIYLSMWDYRFEPLDRMRFYVQFEIIDEDTLDTKYIVKEMNGLLLNEVLDEIKTFVLNNSK